MRRKAELIGEVLASIAADRFDPIEHDLLGEVVRIRLGQIGFDEMEDFFKCELEALHKHLEERFDHYDDLRDAGVEVDIPPQFAEPSLGEEFWTDYWTERLLIELFGPNAGKLAERISGVSYNWLISFLYEFLNDRARQRGQDLIEVRSTLTDEDKAQLEGRILAVGQQTTEDLLASGIAIRLAKRFPKAVNRYDQLRALPVRVNVPTVVGNYLEQATWCYAFGYLIASVMVSRSALEFAVKDFSRRSGRRERVRELEALEEDTWRNLINIAREAGGPHVEPALDEACDIRRRANRIVHQGKGDSEECKDIFIKTRGVLRELYS